LDISFTPEQLGDLEKSREKKIILFTCNWQAYSGLEAAGAAHLKYSPYVYPIKVTCLGQLSSGIILKAFEKGAYGVLLIGCPPGECHFEFGNKEIESVFCEVKELITNLGYKDQQCKLAWIPNGDGQAFIKLVEKFITDLETDPDIR
jgi:coenzyme F420-reducing hydrogenase delta subunit